VTALIAALVLLLGSAAGLYAYALHQWAGAREALRQGRPEDAHRMLDFCLLVWPRSVPVHLLTARAARMHGELAVAEEHLNRCLKLGTGVNEAIQLEYLLLRVQLGEVEQVERQLVNLVESKHPESALILETLAGAYMNNLRYSPALRCLHRWLQLDPDSAQAYKWRGWIYDRMNHPNEALQDYEHALQLDPDLLTVRIRVAELYLERVDPKRAAPHVERLFAEHPDRAVVKARLGQCRMLQGRMDEARELLEAAVEELPDDPLLLIHLAQLDIRQGRPEWAEQWLRRVLKADPADSVARYTLFTALQRQGREQEAQQALADHKKYKLLLERANKLLRDEAEQTGTDPEIPAEAGTILLQIGQERLGLYWLHQALRRDPNHQQAHRALADHYDRAGDKEKADSHRKQLRAGGAKARVP
jgi:predicted Zn-dependent protease